MKMESNKKHTCEICERKFTRSSNLKTHIKTKHDKVSLDFSCYLCRENFKNQEKYLKHIDNHTEGLSFILYKKPLIMQFESLGNILEIIFLSMTF